MKTLGLLSLLSAVMMTVAYCQPPQEEREGDRPSGPPRDPIFQLFDTDQNGELSQTEIEAAAKILQARDRNADGMLTPDELPRPPRRGEDRQPGERPENGSPRPERPEGEPGRPQRDETPPNAAPGAVLFRGGYETDPRDGGRPVALIASALGVKPEVFREAFSNVRPAKNGGPTGEQARANKAVLMAALGKYGITNDRLDEVSNYYRYQPQQGELWTHTPAQATAVIRDGKVVEIKLTNPGSGYLTPPMVTVTGYPDVQVKATLNFTQDFRTNGSIASLTLAGSR